MMDALLFAVLGGIFVMAVNLVRARYASFVAQTPQDYGGARAGQFDIRQAFNGPILCEGVIFGPLGKVTSRFEAEFECRWEGNKCIMDEVFRYDDGSVQNRAWHLTLGNDGAIRAEADDVVGAGSGQQKGDAVQLNYRLRLPEASGGHVLDVVDWMYLAPNGSIINRSQFRKFGVQVAELVATMRPGPSDTREAA